MVIKMGAIEERISQVERNEKEEFADFTVKCEGSGSLRSYVCNDGSFNHAFRVTVWHGSMAITGDSGDFIWSRLDEDMLEWAKFSINDLGYFMEKVVAGVKEEYSREVFAESLLSIHKDWGGNDEYENIQEFIDYADIGDINSAYESYFEEFDDSDMPSCMIPTYSFLWCRESIKWLLSKLESEPKQE